MVKPTPAQLRALEAIRDGRVKLYPGRDHFVTIARSGSRPRSDVVWRLVERGLALTPGNSHETREVVLTAKGGAALGKETP
jgi:hypothetical protein